MVEILRLIRTNLFEAVEYRSVVFIVSKEALFMSHNRPGFLDMEDPAITLELRFVPACL